ncbi:NUDIX domain-containing protein [Methanomethylophilus alvi]|uniref:NUDIX domain-containing protein n=1 Tax=Methanomethylophilus alvi TaxID=1291540 RepID=UPI0037DD576D
MNGDTDDTIYTIAFKDGLFLMVWNPRRKGWEMPGGHVKTGETRIEGAKREFEEESGWTVDIKEVRDLGHCRVCAGILGDRISADHEMTVRMFTELPDELSFPRDEYMDTVPWAKGVIDDADVS